MPDSTTPASQMIRVPTPLIDAVKELSRLHRQGHTRAVLTGLQRLISDIDSNRDSDSTSVSDCDINTDSKIDSEVIAGMIAAAIAPIQEEVARIEKTTTSIEATNILATEISKLNERVGVLERWRLDPSPMAEPTDFFTSGEKVSTDAIFTIQESEAELNNSGKGESEYLSFQDLLKELNIARSTLTVWKKTGKLREAGWEKVPGTGTNTSPSNPGMYRRVVAP